VELMRGRYDQGSINKEFQRRLGVVGEPQIYKNPN